MTITDTVIFKLRVVAIFLMAAGYGWAGGHFIPAGSPFLAYVFQVAVLSILLVLSLGFLNMPAERGQAKPPPKWALRGLNIFATLSLAINLANIVRGFTNSGAVAFGSHNTPDDLVPICMLIVGDVLWIALFSGFNLYEADSK